LPPIITPPVLSTKIRWVPPVEMATASPFVPVISFWAAISNNEFSDVPVALPNGSWSWYSIKP
jgi:hypothetical protein